MTLKDLILDEIKKESLKVFTQPKGFPDTAIGIYKNIIDILLNPTFTPKSLGLTYATIKYWEAKGYLILSGSKEADEWRKYCMLEVFWFQILKKIVRMGGSLDKIVPAIILGYSNLQHYNISIPLTTKTPEGVELNVAGIKLAPLVTFLGHVVEVLTKRSKAAIHITEENCQFFYEKDSDKKAITPNQAYQALFTTGFTISISDVIFETTIGMEHLKGKKIEPFNKKELEVLDLLKKKELKEIVIKLEDGEPISLELKEQFDITRDDAAKRLKEFFFSPYQEVRAVTNRGRTINIERTTKQKL